MKTNIITTLFIILISPGWVSMLGNTEFYAYYTKINSGKDFERYSRTSEHADIIVNIRENEQLVFWRGTSYLPVWSTPDGKWTFNELVKRKGDGSATMPDANNMFSSVRIVKNTYEEIIILWRYLPTFKMNKYPHYPTIANPLDFVEEEFIISNNGNMTRIVKQGSEKYINWELSINSIIQKTKLTTKGIIYLSEKNHSTAIERKVIEGNSKNTTSLKGKLVSFNFDEGEKDICNESISRKACSIKGHKALWKKGVSGCALQFDGYTNSIEFQSQKAILKNKPIILESWICIGAYPWNWVPIIELGKTNSFALGINDKGYIEARLKVENKNFNLTAYKSLNRNRWYHISCKLDLQKHHIKTFINGKVIDSLYFNISNIDFDKDICIGMSDLAGKASDPVRPKFNFPTKFGFDGLIDEVNIYNTEFSDHKIYEHYLKTDPGEKKRFSPDIEIRQLPDLKNYKTFKGSYTNLKYYETWDNMWRFGNYSDIVVGFDKNPSKFVFWKGTNYVPCIVNDKKHWYCNEFNETWGTGGGEGCQEPMSDKKLLTAHARIIEQSPARVVIHWRVALLDTKQNIQANYDTTMNWGDWSDWYYYIYPDGVAAKKMRLWTSGKQNHEWQESMVIVGENTRPEEILEQNPVYHFVDDNGTLSGYNWKDAFKSKIDYKTQRVFICNFKSEWDPFTIGDFVGGNVFRGEEITPYSVFCNWNHWPTAIINCDGRFSSHPDRASHTSLNNLFLDVVKEQKGDAPFIEKVLLEGISNKSPNELYMLSRSWISAPNISDTKGIDHSYFDISQKAYFIEAKEEKVSFNIDASISSPLVNPAFIIKGLDSTKDIEVKIDNKLYETGKKVKVGRFRDIDGKINHIVWLELESNAPITFSVN